MPNALIHPLGDAHCQACNNVMQNALKALELARACKDCGFPVDDIIATLESQLAMAQKTKSIFFPEQP